MIVVTGPGRSGTSLVAQVYKELGFDPGGQWYPEVRAGLERKEVVRVNRRIARELGIGLFRGHRGRTSVRRFVRRTLKGKPGGIRRYPRLDAYPRWDAFDAVVARHSAELRRLSDEHRVVKDPRFSRTLRVWAAAGANLEHVLVCARPLEAMVASRVRAGHAGKTPPGVIRNSLVYYFGLLMATLIEFEIDYDIVRFPDFVRDPELLFRAMRFPAPVSREHFLEAFGRVARHDLV